MLYIHAQENRLIAERMQVFRNKIHHIFEVSPTYIHPAFAHYCGENSSVHATTYVRNAFVVIVREILSGRKEGQNRT